MSNYHSNEKRGVNLRLTSSNAEMLNQFIEEYAYHNLYRDTNNENSKTIREVNNEIIYELESFTKDNPDTEIKLDFFYYKTKKNFKTYNFKNGISKLQENKPKNTSKNSEQKKENTQSKNQEEKVEKEKTTLKRRKIPKKQ